MVGLAVLDASDSTGIAVIGLGFGHWWFRLGPTVKIL